MRLPGVKQRQVAGGLNVGMEQRVQFGTAGCPAWASVAELLGRFNFPVQMRMIDGELALPDEVPPADWKELRVGTPGGMITVRRSGDSVELVTWGNADSPMRLAWNALTWALAHCSLGWVVTAEGRLTHDEYRRRQALPPQMDQG
jgi:hypothetical protein